MRKNLYLCLHRKSNFYFNELREKPENMTRGYPKEVTER